MREKYAKKVICLARSADEFLRLADDVKNSYQNGVVLQYRFARAVKGPPVSAGFECVDVRSPISAIVFMWSPSPSSVPVPHHGEGYEVDEQIVVDNTQDQGGGGLLRFGSQTRSRGLSRAEFARHWSMEHAPLVMRHQPGIVRYVQNVVVNQLSGTDRGFDGFHESTFRNAAAYSNQLFDSQAGREALAADSAQLLLDPYQEERIFARVVETVNSPVAGSNR